MTSSLRAQWAQYASIAVLAMFLAPLPLLVPAEPVLTVLAEVGDAGLAPARTVGATVVVDYGTLALLRVTPSQSLRLERLGVPVTEVPAPTVLDFPEMGIRFDTAAGEPAFAPGLTAETSETAVVQFIGPIKSEWLAHLRSIGAMPETSATWNAYIVRLTGATMDAIRALPFVQWVGAYHPAYKIPDSLRAVTGTTRIAVLGFDDANEFRIALDVTALGGEVLTTSEIPGLVIARVDGGVIDDIARIPSVLSIFPDDDKTTTDSRAGIVHAFSRAWYKEASGLPYTLTGVSNGPDGLRGTSDDIYEIAGISDTGLDEGSAIAGANDFFQGPFDATTNDRVIRFQDRTGCSVPDGARGGRVAHGTHVAGIVASNGYSWEKYLIEDRGQTDVSLSDARWDRSEAGVAPEAKISFDGVNGCTSGVNPSPSYWVAQYNDGARVMVNSWGGGAGNYNSNANAVDDQMDDSDGDGSNDRLIEFSAANMGPKYNTISGDSQAKNGLSIGASQNFRPDQFEADNPDLIADFSSRGGPRFSDGRIKPDLVAIGTAVISNFARGEWTSVGSTPQPDYIMAVDKYHALNRAPGSDGIPDYRYLQGTSMSGPMAAGLYLLAREYLREVHNIPTPNSQLVKALLINGAVRMDEAIYPYPGWDQGWGRIDLSGSLFPDPPKRIQFEEGTIVSTGNTWSPSTVQMDVLTDTVPLKITLVWIDEPSPGFDPGGLVRDLNLKVTSPGGTVYCGNNYASGWSVGFGGPSCGAGNSTWDPDGNGWDSVNNVEQVEVAVPETGSWLVEVSGWNVPTAARFALVVSADAGPKPEYRVDLSTTYSTVLSAALGGSVNLPFTVTNFGTVPDSVLLSSSAPLGITVRVAPTGAIGLQPGGAKDVLATIEVSTAVTPGTKEFTITGTSSFDPSPTGPSTDSLQIRLDVTTFEVPPPLQVTNGTTDELDPSVLVFNASGVRHIFVAYRKTTPVLPGDKLGGVNVWVAHATLDSSGFPVLPFDQLSVSSANDQPNDLRMLRIGSGTYADRVVVTWTGTDPNASNSDLGSYGRIAYADAPYTSWSLQTIMVNEGSDTFNIARVSFPLFRAAGGGGGQLMWVWEHLDYTNLAGAPNRVQTHVRISTDGGATWGTATRVFPIAPTETNFYFFPHGTVDQNDVAWIFAYFRTPTGNDRDLAVRLYDAGGWSASAPVIWDTVDNIQWPVVLSTAEGANANRVYVAVTRDNQAVDLKLWSAYIDGGPVPWSSSLVPRDARFGAGRSCDAGCFISQDFQGPFGPFGVSASNANYNRRPILNLVSTVEAGTTYVWLPYMENGNVFGVPNMWTWYGTDAQWIAEAVDQTTVTADSFAKGHQMTDTLTTNNVARLYEVYHASRTSERSVDYQVYLAIYHRNWEQEADATGPQALDPASVPSLVDLSVTSTMRISANINDVSTGNSNIQYAEYFFNVTGPPLSGKPLFPSDGGWDSPTEGVSVLAGVPDEWPSPSCHVIYIRGQDSAGNWGPFSETPVCIQGFSGPDLDPPVVPTIESAVLAGAGFADIDIRWRASSDEGFQGGTEVYRLFRSPSLAGPWSDVSGIIPGGRLRYNFTDPNVAPNTYFYYLQGVDGANHTSNSTEIAGRTQFAVAAGQNFLSVPFLQADNAITTVLQTVNVRGAWAYDQCSESWQSYDSSRPVGQNSLRTYVPGMGLVVDANTAGVFAVAGIVPTTTTITLCAGWNFVGYPSFRVGYTVASLKAETGAMAVLGFANAPPGYTTVLADTAPLAAGTVYWVKVSLFSFWDIPGQ